MCEGDLFCGINKGQTKDAEKMTDLEKKHIPVITAPKKVRKGETFEVSIEIGKYMKHPNENAHFIEWVELYSGDTFLIRIDFVPRLTEPRVKCIVSLDHAHPLMARARCNLHGLWQSFLYDIKVEE